MADHTDELAGLPEDVRDSFTRFQQHAEDFARTDDTRLCNYVLRIARDIGEIATRNNVQSATIVAMEKTAEGFRIGMNKAIDRAEAAEAELAAIKATPTGTVLDWALRRAESAEAELAALKRRIAEAPTTELHWLDTSWASHPFDQSLQRLIGQRVALLPVGGETK